MIEEIMWSGNPDINNNVPHYKEIKMKKQVKDYVGYILGAEVELNDVEKQFMELEKERLNKVIPVDDLRLFQQKAIEELRVLEYCDLSEEVILEGLKGVNIMLKILENNDTYKDFFDKLSKDEVLKRAYNLITRNVFKIQERVLLHAA